MRTSIIKKNIVYLVVVLFFSQSLVALPVAKKKQKVLFPRREFIKKQSIKFFKQVNMKMALVSKVDFFARSNAYLSAYLAFGPYLDKHTYLRKILSRFESESMVVIEKFEQEINNLSVHNYTKFPAKLGISQYKFFRLSLYTLVNHYRANRLSGDTAFRLWNIILSLTQEAYKEKKKTLDNASILRVSSHLIFFKKCKKWQKRSNKIFKKKASAVAPAGEANH